MEDLLSPSASNSVVAWLEGINVVGATAPATTANYAPPCPTCPLSVPHRAPPPRLILGP